MRRFFLCSSLLLAVSTCTLAAPIYKWVDANGTTHFGNQPPENQASSTVNPVIAPAKPQATQTPEAPAEDPQKAINEKAKIDIAEQEKQRKEYCTAQRNNLAQLSNNPRIRVEENGEARRITEEERQSKIAETQKNISENCED